MSNQDVNLISLSRLYDQYNSSDIMPSVLLVWIYRYIIFIICGNNENLLNILNRSGFGLATCLPVLLGRAGIGDLSVMSNNWAQDNIHNVDSPMFSAIYICCCRGNSYCHVTTIAGVT